MYKTIFLTFTLAACSITASSCRDSRGDSKPAASRPSDAPPTVTLQRVVETPMESVVEVTGILAAYDQATIGLKVTGRIEMVDVDLGSRVRKGQLIARVESEDYELRLQQAEAAVAQARARLGLPLEGTEDRVEAENTGGVRQAAAVLEESRLALERSRRLLSRGLIAKSQMEEVEATFKVAESRYTDAVEEVRNRQAVLAQRRTELALARQQLTDTSVYAPFDGTVEQKQASVGEFLAAGTPVVTIVKMNPLRLQADVPEREARQIRIGQRVRVRVEGDPLGYTGQIVRLSPSIRQDNRTLLVEAEVTNNGSLRSGAFAKVSVVTDGGRSVPAVRAESIVTFAGIEKIIVVEDGKAVEKRIATGRRSDPWVEVTEGLAVGQEYILKPGNLQTGQSVSVARSN